jgi:large subunit ribosomal protein L18Ae
MLKNFEVVARPLPTKDVPNPPAIRVQVFASDEIIAKSKFWAVAKRVARLKRAHGEILAVQQVIEPEPTRVKNYGVWLAFKSVRATHNIYKQYRDTTTEGAVLRLYQEMAGTHSVPAKAISIIRIAEVPPETAGSRNIAQYAEKDVKYPIVKQLIRPAHPSQKKVLSKKRPTICGF